MDGNYEDACETRINSAINESLSTSHYFTVPLDNITTINEDQSNLRQIETTSTTSKNLEKEEFRNSRRRSWKRPHDKPKRPPSSYNLFFQLEREHLLASSLDMTQSFVYTEEDVERIALSQTILSKPKRKHRKTHGLIGFADLARTIASRWKNMEQSKKFVFEKRAFLEKQKYYEAIKLWKGKKVESKGADNCDFSKQKEKSSINCRQQYDSAASSLTSSPVFLCETTNVDEISCKGGELFLEQASGACNRDPYDGMVAKGDHYFTTFRHRNRPNNTYPTHSSSKLHATDALSVPIPTQRQSIKSIQLARQTLFQPQIFEGNDQVNPSNTIAVSHMHDVNGHDLSINTKPIPVWYDYKDDAIKDKGRSEEDNNPYLDFEVKSNRHYFDQPKSPNHEMEDDVREYPVNSPVSSSKATMRHSDEEFPYTTRHETHILMPDQQEEVQMLPECWRYRNEHGSVRPPMTHDYLHRWERSIGNDFTLCEKKNSPNELQSEIDHTRLLLNTDRGLVESRRSTTPCASDNWTNDHSSYDFFKYESSTPCWNEYNNALIIRPDITPSPHYILFNCLKSGENSELVCQVHDYPLIHSTSNNHVSDVSKLTSKRFRTTKSPMDYNYANRYCRTTHLDYPYTTEYMNELLSAPTLVKSSQINTNIHASTDYRNSDNSTQAFSGPLGKIKREPFPRMITPNKHSSPNSQS